MTGLGRFFLPHVTLLRQNPGHHHTVLPGAFQSRSFSAPRKKWSRRQESSGSDLSPLPLLSPGPRWSHSDLGGCSFFLPRLHATRTAWSLPCRKRPDWTTSHSRDGPEMPYTQVADTERLVLEWRPTLAPKVLSPEAAPAGAPGPELPGGLPPASSPSPADLPRSHGFRPLLAAATATTVLTWAWTSSP